MYTIVAETQANLANLPNTLLPVHFDIPKFLNQFPCPSVTYPFFDYPILFSGDSVFVRLVAATYWV